MNKSQLIQYAYLMRLDKPIGIFLLLWPTLWALWLATNGKPQWDIVFIFVLGVIIMRSAGCVINDIADRHLDGHVERTRLRPLVTGKVRLKPALSLFVILSSVAFLLVLQLNKQTIFLACLAILIVIAYPFMKRVTHLPQLGLGIAFAWSVPMAFAAETAMVPKEAWVVFTACIIWPLIYDTMYAMVDYADDVKIGIKSTAILFGQQDKKILAVLQFILCVLLGWIGILFQLHWPYFLSIMFVILLCVYQQILIKKKLRANCFKAFINNHWLGGIVFLGIVLSYWV